MQGDLPAYTAASPAEVEGVGGCVEIVTLVEQSSKRYQQNTYHRL